ncbi:hypothetical protein GCM10010264_68080 [Streptomyces globisporus]|nr:hypothetical protein GCM10010264_68080 [Streptomyces globisporus]
MGNIELSGEGVRQCCRSGQATDADGDGKILPKTDTCLSVPDSLRPLGDTAPPWLRFLVARPTDRTVRNEAPVCVR